MKELIEDTNGEETMVDYLTCQFGASIISVDNNISKNGVVINLGDNQETFNTVILSKEQTKKLINALMRRL